MSNTSNWHNIVNDAVEIVPPVHRLRHSEQVLQYRKGDAVLLSVHDSEPYGAQAPLENGAYLPEVARGEDFTTFEISPEVISLEGLTFGTGRKRAELMKPVYRQMGRLLRELASKDTNRPTTVAVSDIAYDRATDTIILLPPLHFESLTENNDLVDSFVHSMFEHFSNFWLRPTLDAMVAEVVRGE